MFPFLPFLKFPECHCRKRLERIKTSTIPSEANFGTAGQLPYDSSAVTHIPAAIKIEVNDLFPKRANKKIKKMSVVVADLPSTSTIHTDDNRAINKLEIEKEEVFRQYSTSSTAELNDDSTTAKHTADTIPPGTISKYPASEADISLSQKFNVVGEIVSNEASTSEIGENKALPVSYYSVPETDEEWPQPSSKPRFSTDFNMSMEMSFAVGNETNEGENAEGSLNADTKVVDERVTSPQKERENEGNKSMETMIDSVIMASDVSNNKAPLSVITVTEPGSAIDKRNVRAEDTVAPSGISIKKDKEKTLIEADKPISKCPSAAFTSSLIPATSPRRATPSPSSSSAKSPRTTQLTTPAPVNTPPAVRAARALQRAFQPSQAMLDLFGSPDDTSISSSTNQKKSKDLKYGNASSTLSQPGPELVESDASDVIVSTLDEDQFTKKTKRGARGKHEEIIHDGGVTALAKMQLSDPGPEMASESEEVDEVVADSHNEEVIKINETVNEDNALRRADEKINNERRLEEISNGATKLDDEEDEVPSTSEDSEEEEELVEIVVEYDAFGRRFEKEVYKRKEKHEKGEKISKEQRKQKSEGKNNKNGTKKKIQENVDAAAHYESAGHRQQQGAQQQAQGVQDGSVHDNKADNNNNSGTAHSTFTQQRINRRGGVRNDDNNNKTVVHSVTANEWNAENYRHHRGQQTREQQQRQQRSTVADIFKESSATVRRAEAGRNASVENASGHLSGRSSRKTAEKNSPSLHNSSQLRVGSLGDESKRKTPVSSPRTPARTSGTCDKSTARHDTNTPSFDRNDGHPFTFPRLTGGGGGRGGGDPAMINGNGEAAEGATGGENGAAYHVILIRKANIVNEDEIFSGDVLIEDGIITKISHTITAPTNAEVIEASGFWLLPAGIDVHTQFSRESSGGAALLSGTKSALTGGTTTIIEIVSARSGESLAAAVDRVRRAADGNAKCHYGFSIVVGGTWNDQIRGQMTEVVCEKGVNSFLLNFSSDAGTIEALEYARQIGAQCCLLPDNPTIANLLQKHNRGGNDALIKLEAERIQRFCVFSQLTNAPFVLLCPRMNEQVKNALHAGRADGSQVNAEIPLKSLALEYGGSESKSETDHALELLADGVLSMIISNDLSEIWTSPEANSSNGSPSYGMLAAVENRLTLLWEHGVIGAAKLDPMRFVAVTSSNAAKTFNMFPKKGRVSVGSDADLVLWNFDTSRRLGNSTVHCAPNVVICGGDIVVRNGRLVNPDTNTKEGNAVIGAEFIELPPHSPYIFSTVDLKEKTFSMAQLSLSAQKNVKSVGIGGADASRRASLASSCISAATNSDASANDNERKPSTAGSVGHHDINQPITPGARNRNQQSTNAPKRSATKVIQPPGGPSTKFW